MSSTSIAVPSSASGAPDIPTPPTAHLTDEQNEITPETPLRVLIAGTGEEALSWQML